MDVVQIKEWTELVRDVGLILGIPVLIGVGMNLYRQQIEILKERNALLQETQYDRALTMIKAQKEIFELERESLEKSLQDLKMHSSNTLSEKEEEVAKLGSRLHEVTEAIGSLHKSANVIQRAHIEENVPKEISKELMHLAGLYEEVARTMEPGFERMGTMEQLVWKIRHATRQVLLDSVHPKSYLKTDDAGKRIVGLAILEELSDKACFEEAVRILINPKSAFEQGHVLVAMENMVPDLSKEELESLESALTGQIGAKKGQWIWKGTDREVLAEELLKKTRKRYQTLK